MDEKILRKEVESIVASIFSEKDEADQRLKTEETLNESAKMISDLTSALDSKNEEFSAIDGELNEAKAMVEDLQAQLEAAKAEIEKIQGEKAEVETKLEDMVKDRAAEVRMAELNDEGIAHSNVEAQTSKVRDMSEEDFAAYRDELIAVRDAIKSKLSKVEETAEETVEKTETAEETVVDEETASEEETAEETQEETASEEDTDSEETASEDEEVQPAKIDPSKAISAALNMEVMVPKSLRERYANLGKAMAENMKKDKK